MTERHYDVIVLGAGPAGMSAAITASKLGQKTLLLDEQPQPGGQIYRHVATATPALLQIGGPDYRHGLTLLQRLAASGAQTRHGCLVWDVAPDLTVTAQQNGRSFQVRAPQLIAATGALERASPLPGWTLPGVMNAGAAQIALKSSASVPSGRVLLAGAGPLLYLVGSQLLAAGVTLAGIVETSPAGNWRAALPHLPGALRSPKELLKGLQLMARLRGANIPWIRQASDLQIEGTDRVQGLRYSHRGQSAYLAADMVLLHHGVVPDTQLTRLLRVEHDWAEDQLAWKPQLDAWQETSLKGFRVAGDGAGIAGARAAEASGTLAALGAAFDLGRLDARQRDELACDAQAQRMRQGRLRPFLDALYRPPPWLLAPDDATMVCRCEEVTAGQIRQMAALGCQGPNQTKFLSRCGMGPCQGRVCGLPVTQLLAQSLNKSPADIGAYRIRAPLKPIALASFAALAEDMEK